MSDSYQPEYQAYGDTEIVSTYGNVPAEYAAIHKSCGVMDLPQRTVIELSGKDRLAFLNNLLTNEVKSLRAGETRYAFLLDAKTGRIQSDVVVVESGERTLLAVDKRVAAAVAGMLERYHFAEQVRIRALEEVHCLALHGPNAEKSGAFSENVTVYMRAECGVPGLQLVISGSKKHALWQELVEKGIRPVGWAAYNAARIEAGTALFGIDFDESILPAETGLLEQAVSFTKGCYPGQEIVARMHARQQVAKKLVGIRMSGEELPIAGAKVFDEMGNEIGGITSSTISPILSNAAICLGYVKRPHFEVRRVVRVPAEGALRQGVVVQTPFVKR